MKLSNKYLRKIKKELGSEADNQKSINHYLKYCELEARIELTNNIRASQHTERKLYQLAEKDNLV